MQPNLQHVDPHADPHDAIAAQLRDLAPRIADDPSGLIAPAASPEASREPSFHTAPLNDNDGESLDLTSRTGPRRGMLIVIVCAGIAAAVAWHTYADAARQQISHLVPQLIPAALVPAPTASAEPQSEVARATATPQLASDPSNAQDASAAPTESGATAPAAAAQNATSPDTALLIESMTREIASLKQTVEQLQSGQQQLGRDIAKINEQEARRKASAQAAKPVSRPQAQPQRPVTPPVVSSRAPVPYPSQAAPQVQSYPQGPAQRDAYVAPPPPMQLPPQPGDTSAPRPPLPLR